MTKYNEEHYIGMVIGGASLAEFDVENRTEKVCMVAVSIDGYELKYVKNQTEEICLAAVRQEGLSLIFVNKQTEEICWEAVYNAGEALEYVKNQTKEICLTAIRCQSGSIRFVKNQTEEMCLLAVCDDASNIRFVKNQTEEMCWLAIKSNYWTLEYIKEQTEEMIKYALNQDSATIVYIDADIYKYNYEDIEKAIKRIRAREINPLLVDETLKKIAEILNRLSDEELVKTVKHEVAFLFKNKLYKCEELTAIKQKVDMLCSVEDKINNSEINALKTKRKVL